MHKILTTTARFGQPPTTYAFTKGSCAESIEATVRKHLLSSLAAFVARMGGSRLLYGRMVCWENWRRHEVLGETIA